MYEQDKFELLFEKSYLNHILGMFLDKFANQEIVELMPDGSRSIEDSQAKNLIKLIADLVADEELAKTNVKIKINFVNKQYFSIKKNSIY